MSANQNLNNFRVPENTLFDQKCQPPNAKPTLGSMLISLIFILYSVKPSYSIFAVLQIETVYFMKCEMKFVCITKLSPLIIFNNSCLASGKLINLSKP